MLKLMSNITFLFAEYEFLDRFAKAKEAGFNTVEFRFPESFNVDFNLDAVESKLKEAGIRLYTFNFPADVNAVGGRGVANDPAKRKEFRKGVDQAIAIACRLGVTNINFFCGFMHPNYSEAELWDTLVDNLRYAADELKNHNLNLTFEPLNHYDNPNIFIESMEKGIELYKKVAKSNTSIIYDIYHGRMEGEDIFKVFRDNLYAISHIQIADHPGRHQPGTGDIDMMKFLKMVDESEYKGYVSLEYKPVPDTLSTLRWFKDNGYDISPNVKNNL